MSYYDISFPFHNITVGGKERREGKKEKERNKNQENYLIGIFHDMD